MTTATLSSREPAASPAAAAGRPKAASRAHRRDPQASGLPQPPTIAAGDVAPFKRLRSPANKLPEHVRQNSTVRVVSHFLRRIDSRHHGELLLHAVRALRPHGELRARLQARVQPVDVEPGWDGST